MSLKELDLIFPTSLYFSPTMNSVLEPLLLAILGDKDRGWSPACTPLRGGFGSLIWSEQGCRGGRKGTKHSPESTKGNSITTAQSLFFLLGWSLCEVLVVPRLGHLWLGSLHCLTFTGTSRAGKGAWWVRTVIPLPPLPQALSGRDPCYWAEVAILLLWIQPGASSSWQREVWASAGFFQMNFLHLLIWL